MSALKFWLMSGLALVSASLAFAATYHFSVYQIIPVSLADAAIARLERRFPPAVISSPPPIAGIIVLGGQDRRVDEALRLAARFPAATLVITGASQKAIDHLRAGAGPAQNIIIEPFAKNTFENAFYTKKLVRRMPGERWLLVTSAIHMPRAMGSFERVQFPVEPWPVYDTPSALEYALPAVLKEYLGLLSYRLLNRTQSLFPDPIHENGPLGSSERGSRQGVHSSAL